jgi:hypothetical protein
MRGDGDNGVPHIGAPVVIEGMSLPIAVPPVTVVTEGMHSCWWWAAPCIYFSYIFEM